MMYIGDAPAVSNYDTGFEFTNIAYELHSDGESIKTITVYDFCSKSSNGCGAGTGYSIQIDWIKNPLW